MRREKPSARWAEWTVEFGGKAVGIAEEEVGAPLGAITGDVEKRESRGLGEGDVFTLGAVDFKAWLQSGRAEDLFVEDDDEHLLAVIARFDAVVGGVELADTGEPRQDLIEFTGIQRMSQQGLQEFEDGSLGIGLNAADFD